MNKSTALLLIACSSLFSGCISRYESHRQGLYGTSTHSSRELYGNVALGNDSFTASPDTLHNCLRDSLAYESAQLELDAARVEIFQEAFPGYLMGYGLDSSRMTDRHLLCLGIASGYDLASAAAIARGLAYGNGGGYYQQWRVR